MAGETKGNKNLGLQNWISESSVRSSEGLSEKSHQ